MVQKPKAAFIVLAMVGIFALFFGMWQFRYRIYAPFKLKPSNFKFNTAQSSLLDLQTKDTDKDGLSDYEELYIHGTSPYIEDSDSDGSDDYSEIAAGTDPNCPTGKDCKTASAKTSPSALSVPGATDWSGGATSSAYGNSALDRLIQLDNMSAQDVRAMLKSAGMDENALKKIDDKTIMELYKKALAESN
jgi:hypothetical protein